MIITIDGPAGSGKSTIAKLIAEKTGFTYLDTGSMYRGITFLALSEQLDLSQADDIAKLISLASTSIWVFQDNCRTIYLNGENITEKIRLPEINANVSKVSEIAAIREVLVLQQRAIASEKDCILDGRDAGTVIFPQAELKIYLDASPTTRAHRRYLEQLEKGQKQSESEVLQSVLDRDNIDMNRKIAPLRQAEDAIYLDSSDMTRDEVVATILKYYQAKTN